MANFDVPCPFCGEVLCAGEELINKSVQCPKCNQSFVVHRPQADPGTPCLKIFLGVLAAAILFTGGMFAWLHFSAKKAASSAAETTAEAAAESGENGEAGEKSKDAPEGQGGENSDVAGVAAVEGGGDSPEKRDSEE